MNNRLFTGDRVTFTNKYRKLVGNQRVGTVVADEGYGLPGRVGVRWDDDPEYKQVFADYSDDPEYCKHVENWGVSVNAANLKRVK